MTDECNRLCALLEAKEDAIHVLESELLKAHTAIEQLKVIEHSALEQEVEHVQLKGKVHKEAQKTKRFWKLRCDQMFKYEEDVNCKDTEIALLKACLLSLERIVFRLAAC